MILCTYILPSKSDLSVNEIRALNNLSGMTGITQDCPKFSWSTWEEDFLSQDLNAALSMT